MYSCPMGESSGSSNQMTLPIQSQSGLGSYLPLVCFDPSGGSMEGASGVTSIEESIEKSKSHWSQLVDFDSNNEVAEVSNMELFKTLRAHPTWGSFFIPFGKGVCSCGELVMGEKFAEGGQAEIYEVQVQWRDPRNREDDLKESIEYVLKVFKKGTFLRQLQSQWPLGMLQMHEDIHICRKLGLSAGVRFVCAVIGGTLLEDGRFAFLMVKEKEDLRNMINRQMLMRSNIEGPFSNEEALLGMYEVAYGMNQLHNRGIVHRDIKASNVLILAKGNSCLVADFECSVGVVGTGFFRAPEILEACKYGNVNAKEELFTKAVDIYSYGMTCYEILTGKLPFEGHSWNDNDHVIQGQRPELPNYVDHVIQGQRPELPNYVDGWIRQLLNRCWQSNPVARPTSQEILKILRSNSAECRDRELRIQKQEVKWGTRKVVDRRLKFLRMWRSLQLKLRSPKLTRLSS